MTTIHLYYIIHLLFTSSITNAQWYDPEKVDHNANTIYTWRINKAQNDD